MDEDESIYGSDSNDSEGEEYEEEEELDYGDPEGEEDDDGDPPEYDAGEEDDDANEYITGDEEEKDPRRAKGVQRASQSSIGWNMEHNSPIRNQFNSFDSRDLDPYNSANRYMGESINRTYSSTGDRGDFEDKQAAISAFDRSISSRYGTSVRVSGTGIYNRTIRSTGSTIGSNQQGQEISLYKPPRGLVARPVDRDWNTFQEGNKGLHMREAVYQIQESSYVGGLINRGNKVKTEVITQGFSPVTVAGDQKASMSSTKTMMDVLFGNEVTLDAFTGTSVEGHRVTMDNEGDSISPAFHPKLSYYYGEDAQGNKQVMSGTIGTQNRTKTLKTRESLEEVLFLHMDMVDDKNNKAKMKMQRVLGEIASATDAMFSLSGLNATANQARTLTSEAFASQTPNSKYVKLNKDIHTRRLEVLQQTAGDNTESKVVLSVQYLETALFGSTKGLSSSQSEEYDQFRRSFFETIETLSTQGRLTLMTTATSKGSSESLFALFDRLNNPEQNFTLFGDDAAEDTRSRIRSIVTTSASVAPTRLKHSKGFAILNKEGTQLEFLEVSSANFSHNSFARNIESGIFLNRSDIEDLNLNSEDTLRYFRDGLMNKMSNDGIYVERKGDRDMTRKAADILLSIGGVETRTPDKAHGFRFSRRYNSQGEETGLDIVMKNKYTISVTIGSTQESRYDVKTGEQTLQEVPIVYINKGNRIITGMDWINQSSKNIVVQSSAFDSRAVDGQAHILTPGQSVSVDALQVLSGIVYTMNQGMAYEENSRVMLMGLEKLLEQGNTATIAALRQTGASVQQAEQKLAVYKDLVTTGNIEGVTQRSKEIGQLLEFNTVANHYYKTALNTSKKDLFNRLIEIYPQSHELSYSHGQLMWKRPLYGVTVEVEDIHYGDNKETVIAPSFLMSEMPLDHTEYLRDAQGLAFLRGATESARPSSLNQTEMVGGLIRVEGGVHTPYSMQLLNTMPGLSLISYVDYEKRLQTEGIDPDSGYGLRLLETVFALEKRRMEEEEAGSWETRKRTAVMLYTPYAKTEQNPGRFKNLKSIRNFLPANLDFANFVRSLGRHDPTNFQATIDAARDSAGDLQADDLVGGIIPFAMPSAQFGVMRDYAEKNPGADLQQRAKEIALDTDETMQGYINSPTRVMASFGIGELNDFSIVNTAYANSREKAYLKTYRAQAAMSLNEMNMTAVEFNALIAEKLKVGTMFVSRDVRIREGDEHLGEAHSRIRGAIDTHLRFLSSGSTTIENATQQQIKDSMKTMTRMHETSGAKAFAFLQGLDYRGGEFFLKKGVYRMDGTSEGWLNRIGGINEGDNSFYIDDMVTYKSLGSKSRLQPFRIKAPAFSGRELGAISILYKTPVSAEQDQRAGMVTYNFEMVDISNIKTGQRTSQAKGPLRSAQRGFFDKLQEIYDTEVGDTSIPTQITGEDVFAVISAGQMKGFVFEAGLGFLREGENSRTWQTVSGSDRNAAGYKVAEALTLMMMGDEDSGGTKLSSLLQDAYRRDAIDGRRQAAAMLQHISAKKVAKKDQASAIERDFAPTIALYEGLMSLANPMLDDPNAPVEQTLIDTVAEALSEGPQGDIARERLANRAQGMLERARENYALEVSPGQYSYEETKARSSSVLAFFLNASRDLMGDINKDVRLQADGLSEVSYSGGFIDKYERSDTLRSTVAIQLNKLVAEEIAGIANSSLYHGTVPAMAPLIEQVSTRVTDYLQRSGDKSVGGLMLEVDKALYQSSTLREGIESIIIQHGGISASEMYLTRIDDQRYGETAALFREAVRQQTFSLNVDLPSYQRIWNLQDTQSKNAQQKEELGRLLAGLNLSMHTMRTLFQFDQKMNLPFDMTINKITVPTGMEDTTALEGHYANALTQQQLDLYTYSGGDKEKARSLQQTMVILGSMLQEGLGSTLTQTNVSQMYSIRRTSATLLGYTEWEEEDVSDPRLTAAEVQGVERRNALRVPLQREIESQLFTLTFSEGYGVFTSQSRANIFPSKTRSAVDVEPARELFYQFISGNKQSYNEALERMSWNRRVSSDRSNLSREEKATAITKDYLRRIKSNDTIVGGQVDNLLQGITERALESLQGLEDINNALFIEPFTGTDADDRIDAWAGNISESGRTRAIDLMRSRGINISADATLGEVTEAVKLDKFRLRTLSQEQQLDFASLGLNELQYVMGSDGSYLMEGGITNLSMDRRKSAFAQLLVREKVRDAVAKGSTAQGAISIVQDTIQSTGSIAERAQYYINTAPAAQEMLLESIIRNEVETKLKRAEVIDPGKEYIEGRQKLRSYAQSYISTGVGSQNEKARAQSIIDSVEKTYSVSIPVLQLKPAPNADGSYNLQFMPEKDVEGWVLGLDVLERMSLVFPGHTHEALQAQYGLMDNLSLANESGMFLELARAAREGREVNLNSYQLGIYQDLMQHAQNASEQVLKLSNNKETFRKTMGDRLTMTGASFIGMNSYLVRSTEVVLGGRVDSLVKDNSGSGIRNLFNEMAKGIQYHHRQAVTEQTATIAQQIQTLDADYLSLTEPTAQAENRNRRMDLIARQNDLRNNLQIDYNNLDPSKNSEQKLMAYGQLMEGVVRSLATELGGTEGQNVTWQQLLQMAADPQYQFAQQATAQTQGYTQGQAAQQSQAQTTQQPSVVTGDSVRYTPPAQLISDLIGMVGGESSKEGTARMEKLLFRSAILVARQGAPSGVFHTYGSGHAQKTVEEYNQTAKLVGSLLGLEDSASSTAMLISAMGHQFTQLGDYDGDSFQAAFTKMSASTRELAEANSAMLKAEKEYYSVLESETDDPIVQNKAIGTQNMAFAKLNSAVDDFLDKMRSLRELQQGVEQQGAERVRNYISDFMSIPMEFLQGDGTSTGAIEDSELPSLVKQYRDTGANLYGNQDKVKGSLPTALAIVNTIQLNKAQPDAATIDFGTNQVTEPQSDVLSRVAQDYTEYANEQDVYSFNRMSLEKQREELIEFSSIMTQKLAAMSGLDVAMSKATGTLINTEAMANVQAIMGSTGTGLLGKTYNTVVPLLGLAVADLSSVRAMQEASGDSQDTVGTVYTEALSRQAQVLQSRISVAQSAGQDISVLQGQLDMVDAMRTQDTTGQRVPYQLEEERLKGQLNSTFGLLLDVQQFLRDAGVKPKEGGSVALEAARFEYTFNVDGTQRTVRGLNRILDMVDETERSKVMGQFIGTKAASVLATDYNFTYDDAGNVQAGESPTNAGELRAFAALEMVNEYLSGKMSAQEMMSQSAFAGFFQQRRQQMVEEDPNSVPPSAEFIVESTIADSLAKFRTDFIYNAVLEGDKYGAMLDKFDARLQQGYSQQGIDDRVAAYEQKVTSAYTQQYNGVTLSPQEQQNIDSDIQARTSAWRLEEQNRAAVMESARARAQASGGSTTESKEVFKAILQYEHEKQAQTYVGTPTEGGLFSSLRALNKVVTGLQQDSFGTPGTPNDFQIAQTAILYNIARGKLEGTTLNESIYRLATAVQQGDSSAQAVGALLSVGGATSLPGLMEFVQQHALKQAGGNTSQVDDIVKQSLITLGEILTTQVDIGGGRSKSYAEILAEKSVVAGASSGIQQEIAELNMQEANARQAAAEGEFGIDVNETIDQLYGRHRRNLEQRAEEMRNDPEKAVSHLNNEYDVVSQALNDIQGEINQNIAQGIRDQKARKGADAFSSVVENAQRAQVRSGTMSLLAIPLLFSIANNDTPITERVVDLAKNIVESALTLSMNEGSITRQFMLGEGSGAEIGEQVRRQIQETREEAGVTPTTQTIRPEAPRPIPLVEGDTQDAVLTRASVREERQRRANLRNQGQAETVQQPAPAPATATAPEANYVTEEQERMERNTARTNYMLQVARAKEFMFRADDRVQGTAQAVAFEAINVAGSYAASNFAQKTRLLRDDSIAARGALEVMGSVVGMALAGVVTKRPIVGTSYTQDFAFDATVGAIAGIKNNILAASQRALGELVNGADVDITDGYTGETLDALLAEGDVQFDDDNTSVSAVERLLMTEGMMGEEEGMYTEEE